MMSKSILPLFAVLIVLSTAGESLAQAVQLGPTISPFHNINSGQINNQNQQAGNNPQSPYNPGALSIPTIMPTKRPLPRKPVQPVFVMKGIDLGADAKIQSIDKVMRSYSGKLIEARRARDNRRAMQYVRKMEKARQRLLRHLREVAPVEQSFAPVPKAKKLPTLPDVNPSAEELPILPMPKMPAGGKNK